MNPLPGKQYGPPSKLDYTAPVGDVRATWGPSTWDYYHTVTVRGVEVYQLGETMVDSRDICYRWCVFPDQRVMKVNEGNIRTRKEKKNGHTIK